MIPSTALSFPFSLPSPSTIPILNPNPSSNFSYSLPSRRFICQCRRSPRDSNAESVRPGRFRFRDEVGGEDDEDSWRSSGSSRWWWSDDLDDEFDPFDDEKEEEIWDKIWIFKVFKSYGYLLPAIIASMLLATGPKAFLMALALPLGQSAISLAIDKVWGRASGVPRSKTKTRKKPFARSSSNFRKKGQEESSDYRGQTGYQSWVPPDSVAADKVNGSRRSSLGGWEELDNNKGSMRRKPPASNGSAKAEPGKNGKLSRKGRYRAVPLFLRLLIAVFPFLGSWTRIL